MESPIPIDLGPEEPAPEAVTLDLIGRARSGDSAAYDALFAGGADRVLLFIRARLGRALAEKVEPMDILQASYAQAHRAFARFEYTGPGSFVRWVCRIAENQIRAHADHFAASKRHQPGNPLPVTAVLARHAAAATGVATAFGRAEDRERLLAALDTMEDEERQAILLRFFQDQSLDQIAVALGKPETTARRVLGRAVRRLGELFGER